MPGNTVPFNLKVLRGNPGQRRLRPEPQPAREAQCPPAPSFLSKYAQEEWERVSPELHALGLLSVLDTMVLGIYRESYSRWRAAVDVLQRLAASDPQTYALLTTDKDGTRRRNPLVQVASAAADDMLASAREFGLTPVARSRLAAGIGGQPPRGRKFDGLLAGDSEFDGQL